MAAAAEQRLLLGQRLMPRPQRRRSRCARYAQCERCEAPAITLTIACPAKSVKNLVKLEPSGRRRINMPVVFGDYGDQPRRFYPRGCRPNRYKIYDDGGGWVWGNTSVCN
jgi:hypothetical protein